MLAVLGASGGAAAQAPGDRAAQVRELPGLITTQVQAHRRLPSTVSDASVSIEVHGRDLRGTATQLGRQAQALLAFLRTQPTERLRTEGTSFDPEIQELRGQPDRIKGYTGRISVSFRTVPEQLPFVLAGCLDNGATTLGQFGSSPREEEVAAARRDMVEEATRAAMTQVQTIASAAGQKVAGIELVVVDPPPGFDPAAERASYTLGRAAMPRPAPPIAPIASEAGSSDLPLTVAVTVRVARPD